MFFLMGTILVFIAIILGALHIVVRHKTIRMAVVIAIGLILCFIPTMHTIMLGLILISCEVLINKIKK